MTASNPNNRNLAINYIEFVVRDLPRAKAFYAEAFDWSFTDYGPDYAEFSDGAMKGGLTTLGTAQPAGGPLVILYADDLGEAQRRVEAAGGTIVKPAYAFPGGRRFHFGDVDGHELAVWSTN